MARESADDEIPVLGDVLGALVGDDVVLHEHAPVQQEVVDPERGDRRPGGEEQEHSSGVGAEVPPEQLLLLPREAALRGDGHQQRGVAGNLARRGEVEVLDVEVAHLELVPHGGEAADRVGVAQAQLPVPGEKVDLLPAGRRDVEDRGGERLLAAEGDALLVPHRVELGHGDDAALVARDEHDDVGLVDPELLRAAAVLVDVEEFARDPPGRPLVGGVHVLLQQAAHFGMVALRGEREDGVDGAREVADVGEGLG